MSNQNRSTTGHQQGQPCILGSNIVFIRSGDRKYEVDVAALRQKNVKTGNTVTIKREVFDLGARRIQRSQKEIKPGSQTPKVSPALVEDQGQTNEKVPEKQGKENLKVVECDSDQKIAKPKRDESKDFALFQKVQWKWENNSKQMVPYSQELNFDIEAALKIFQKSGKPSFTVIVKDDKSYSIDFIKMQQVDLQTGGKSGVQWYWQDYESGQFNKYSKDVSIQIEATYSEWFVQKDNHRKSLKSSWKHSKSCLPYILPIHIGAKHYEINVKAMTQKNFKTGNSIKIKREEFLLGPRKIQRDDLEKIEQKKFELKKLEMEMKAKTQAGLCLPEFWDERVDQTHPILVNVSRSSDEYQEVKRQFESQVERKKIICIKRIQNLNLWRVYQAKKISMDETQKDFGANEKMLWHGTSSETASKIVQQGFNRSFCGKNATVYGNGVYFAASASYSSSPTYSVPDHDGVQMMFLAKVLVGEYAQGRRDMRTPPVKIGNILYDSVVDRLRTPGMYVIFSDPQAYPAYILKFKSAR